MAPGDVLFVRGSGRLSEIGTAHGLMGHVLLVLSPPISVWKYSQGGRQLEDMWPGEDVQEIWRVRTMESTRSEQGLFESEVFLYVEKATGKLTLIAEVHTDREGCDHVHVTDHEAIELWQSPGELRSQIRIDLMQKVLHEMKEYEANWSHVTAVRAVFASSRLTNLNQDPVQAMESLKACWRREPICTSVVIIFWQRYLCELAAESTSSGPLQAASLDFILKWMPLKADRGLPGDLVTAMQSAGWVRVAQVPRIFRPVVMSGLAVPSPRLELGPPARRGSEQGR